MSKPVLGPRTRAAEKGIGDELKWAEPSTRTEAGAWDPLFKPLRQKRLTIVGEAMEARLAAESVRAMVVSLERLLRCKWPSGWASPLSILPRPNGYGQRGQRVTSPAVSSH